NGNKTEAAAQLGVTPRTLRNKIARWKELKKAG
ncbi:MAG: helix-turn-helix domain-containing protein, partial [Planctomycetota bacterium]